MQNNIEIVFKQPEGKLPFIGLLYSNAYNGKTDNQDIVNSYKNYTYKLDIEPLKQVNRVNIHLHQPGMNLKAEYKDVSVNFEKLKKFLTINFNAKFFNFGHITVSRNAHELLRTSINSEFWVLKLDEIKVIETF